MGQVIAIRPARNGDLNALERLFDRSYSKGMAGVYTPETCRTALPMLATVRPKMIAAGTYYLAKDDDGEIIGAGGWSWTPPFGGLGPIHMGYLCPVTVEPAAMRSGIGSAIIAHARAAARDASLRTLDCYATLNARQFYQANGFRLMAEVDLTLAPGVLLPALHMRTHV